jgi:hypothetical protein
MNRITAQRWLILALLLATGLALLSTWETIGDPYSVQDDFRKLYWMNRFQDPGLYPDDPSIGGSVKEFQLGPIQLTIDINRPIYSLLFYLAAPFFSPVLFNKLLLFPLLWISVYYLVRIGERVKGGGTGFLLAMAFVVLNLASPSSIDAASGLPRSFALPVLVTLIYYLMVRRYVAAALVVAVGGLVYVPLFVLGGLTLALSLLGKEEGRPRIKISWIQAALLTLLVLFAAWMLRSLIGVYVTRITRVITGEVPGFAAILQNPYYATGGRLPLFDVFPFMGHGGLFNKGPNFWQTISLAVMSLALWLLLPGSIARFPQAMKKLLLASIIAFSLAWLHILVTASFALYFPSRYMRASLFLVFFFFTFLNLEDGIRQAASRVAAMRAWQRWALLGVMVVYGAGAVYLLNNQASKIFRAISALHYGTLVAVAFGFLLTALLIRIITLAGQTPEATELRWQPRRYQWLVLGGLLLVIIAIFWLPRQRPDFLSASPADRKVLSFVETLPQDVLIGGEPCWLSSLPILTGRKVLWSCEQMGDKTTIADTLEAYYAEMLAEVGDFCAAYDVDYMAIDPRLFAEESIRSGRFFFEPYASELRSWVGRRTSFALQQPADIPRAVGSGNIFIIPCPAAGLAQGSGLGDDLPQVTIDAALDDGVRLDGYDVLTMDVSPGGGIAVTLHWRAETTPSTDYTVFVHLVDWSVPGVVAQSDSHPAQGRRPTSTWQAGDTVLDTHYFTLPEELPPGQYELIVGMYRLDTLERLRVAGEESDYIKLAGPF